MTKYISIGKRKVPYFSGAEVQARGQVPLEKLVVGEAYWHIPGGELFVVDKVVGDVIEGELHIGRWRSWLINVDASGSTLLYPTSDVELGLLKDIIEDSRWWIGLRK